MSKLRAFLLTLVISSSLAVGGIVIAAGLADDGAIDSGADVHGQLHHQHGGGDGHLAGSSENVRVIGKMNVNQDFEGRVSDVGVFGNYAYLGAFNERDCQKGGVYVFDISKPTAPKQINFIRSANNSYVGEGVQIIRVDTPQYTGDLLIHNNEICGPTNTGAKGGISLVDVTNPKVHKWLAEGVGDFLPAGANGASIAHTVHSAFAWDAGDKAYVVLVDNEEGADVDIMDITNPRSPTLIAEYDLNTTFPQIIQADLGTGESFLHDMIVKQINGRYVMLLSYWDGGYVQLDVTDPLNISYLADSDFAAVDPEALESGFSVKPEGNAHQAEFSKDNDFIIAADEDFAPYSVVASNTTEGTTFNAVQGSDTPQIAPGTSLAGVTKFVGRACPGGPAVPPGAPGEVAVVERGDCLFSEKIAAVEAAGGYSGVIVFNREGGDGCSTLILMDIQGGIPAIFVDRATGFALLNQAGYDEAACQAGSDTTLAPIEIGRVGDNVDMSAVFDGWGYVHLYKNGAGKLVELDTYAIPEAHDPAFAAGSGDLSVHEVAMSAKRNDLAYFAYYSGGFRVVKIAGKGSRAQLIEAGHFIDQGGSNFWGVQLWNYGGKEYVLASDRDYGVYIFEYTGP
jgi:hypothetical protein